MGSFFWAPWVWCLVALCGVMGWIMVHDCAPVNIFGAQMDIFLRLREERERLDLSQPVMAALGGVQKRAQINYESGERIPDAAYLLGVAKAGVDVLYVITGQRAGGVKPAPTLTSDEEELLSLFRSAPLAVKAAAIGALQGGANAKSTSLKAKSGSVIQTNTGQGAVQIGTMGAPPPKKRRS